MGSDLHMSPPTPDEKRIVRSGQYTAMYTRHTDGIYGDTNTWTRKLYRRDPERDVLETLILTTDAQVTTMADGSTLPMTAPREYFSDVDREWDKEEKELVSKVHRAEEKAARAWEGVVAAKVELERFKDERKASGL